MSRSLELQRLKRPLRGTFGLSTSEGHSQDFSPFTNQFKL